jgi:hypothetical protein
VRRYESIPRDERFAQADIECLFDLHDRKDKPVSKRNWYGYNKNTIRNFVDGRLKDPLKLLDRIIGCLITQASEFLDNW